MDEIMGGRPLPTNVAGNGVDVGFGEESCDGEGSSINAAPDYAEAVGVPAEFAETPPPTKCHLSIIVTTSTRNMDARSESFLLLTQRLARRLPRWLTRRLTQLTG
ncbi:Hypothetical predicted protein [Scomber scombrus]|uniref:Uncharacterized protein n=1 Tax=Scomber scombrus TaxID=13677 RepID=A0AAV1PFD4_SCOSC